MFNELIVILSYSHRQKVMVICDFTFFIDSWTIVSPKFSFWHYLCKCNLSAYWIPYVVAPRCGKFGKMSPSPFIKLDTFFIFSNFCHLFAAKWLNNLLLYFQPTFFPLYIGTAKRCFCSLPHNSLIADISTSLCTYSLILHNTSYSPNWSVM